MCNCNANCMEHFIRYMAQLNSAGWLYLLNVTSVLSG
jgi:hypothetical protein